MSNALADIVTRQAEAAALWHADVIAAQKDDIASIEAVVEQAIAERNARHAVIVDYLTKAKDAENEADRLTADKLKAAVSAGIARLEFLSAKVLAGEAILPPATTLAEPKINMGELVELPRIPLSIADLAAPPSAEAETSEPEQQAA